jgi:hypothetical protein
METNLGSLFRIALFIHFLSISSVAQLPSVTTPGPVPAALGSAKTVFVSNAGSDSGLFPHPFSGDPNRSYVEFYSNLKASGQFALVDDPSQADLVLELRLLAPYGPAGADKQKGAADPLPMFRLTVYDRKTHYALWTVTESIAVANLQKTHDRNFDDALDAVLAEFLQVAGKQAPQAH